MPLNLTAAANDDGRRLDRILRRALPDLALSAIHRLLRKGAVLVDGRIVAADYRVSEGQTITIPDSKAQGIVRDLKATAKTSCLGASARATSSVVPEILFEGAGLLVLNKPAGLTVHGQRAGAKESLADQVQSYLGPKIPPSLSFRSGPLHRLDTPSSGLIVFSTSLEGARIFSALLRERKIKKTYLALVEGILEKDEIWKEELIRNKNAKKTFSSRQDGAEAAGSKTAQTRVKPLAKNENSSPSGGCTLILAEIETGRTHQIRAQAASHGHPLLGDKKYGAKPLAGSFFLHAWRVEIPMNQRQDQTSMDQKSDSSGFPRRFEAPIPEKFKKKIAELFGKLPHI